MTELSAKFNAALAYLTEIMNETGETMVSAQVCTPPTRTAEHLRHLEYLALLAGRGLVTLHRTGGVTFVFDVRDPHEAVGAVPANGYRCTRCGAGRTHYVHTVVTP